MSSTSSPTLLLDVRCRRARAGVAASVLGGVAAAAWTVSGTWAGDAGAPAAFGGVLSALCSGLAALGLRRAGWLGGARRLETASWLSDGRWILRDCAGVCTQAVLHPQTRVGRNLVWLRWQESGGRRAGRAALLTMCDLPADDMRRLVVRLHIEGLRDDQRLRSRGVVAA